jgi:Protein of unknown function (DUF1161)
MMRLAILLALALAAAPAMAGKPCDELKTEIAAKIDANGVKHYTLEIVPIDAKVDDGKVVGTCDGHTKKIVYRRG